MTTHSKKAWQWSTFCQRPQTVLLCLGIRPGRGNHSDISKSVKTPSPATPPQLFPMLNWSWYSPTLKCPKGPWGYQYKSWSLLQSPPGLPPLLQPHMGPPLDCPASHTSSKLPWYLLCLNYLTSRSFPPLWTLYLQFLDRLIFFSVSRLSSTTFLLEEEFSSPYSYSTLPIGVPECAVPLSLWKCSTALFYIFVPQDPLTPLLDCECLRPRTMSCHLEYV